jgi:signal transduction histidine kinase
MPTLNFTVDAKLLQELGKRLVGKPSVALAELVKNSYDADAHIVEIGFYPERDEIRVTDDGHGMTFEDFENFWMRVGTTHKDEKRVSPYLGREMTGSKGVGRLAVQVLAKRLSLMTVPLETVGQQDHQWIEAKVNWEDAVEAGELTSATVEYQENRINFPFEHGTELILTGLNSQWSEDELRELAREIWWLRPPFRSHRDQIPDRERFEIRLEGAEEYMQAFEGQLDAVLYIQTARLVGRCHKGIVNLAVEFWSRGTPYRTLSYTYRLADLPHNDGGYDPEKNLSEARFEIRIYNLRGRQPKGIKISELREYMDRFAGIHVYDGGFRLPYYGDPSNDSFRIEYEHSHRLFVSELLPKELQEQYGQTERLRYLPTLRRVFGVVKVSTAKEENLDIAITRDRLIKSKAHNDLIEMVRYAMHRYAFDEALRAYKQSQSDKSPVKADRHLERLEDVLEDYRSEIPKPIYESLQKGLGETAHAIEREQDLMLSQTALLGPLATAGISALAIQHEMRKQFSWMQDIIADLRAIDTTGDSPPDFASSIADELESWLDRARSTNALFDYMAGDTVRERDRYNARSVIQQVLEQTRFLGRGVMIDIDAVDEDIYLPEATFAEWGAIFQNVFTNAFNAMWESEERRLYISSRRSGVERAILVQDTGKGVDLDESERLFEPFERGTESDPQRMQMGYGGTGLGLTIVRLLTQRIGCRAKFVRPDNGFNTAFALEWKESKR